MKELTQDNLQEIINQNKSVMVQYGASWCGMCKVVKPKFKRLADENPEIEFYYVDAEQFPQSRELADIQNLPTIAGFKDGKLVKQLATSKEEAIKEIINETANN
jgi:thioredoxin 1